MATTDHTDHTDPSDPADSAELQPATDQPDRWVIVRVTRADGVTLHRIFATWFGGFMGSDCWQMNSGIKAYREFDTFIDFYGHSGSIYRCHREAERLSGYGSGVLGGLQRRLLDSGMGKIEIIRLEEFKLEFTPQPSPDA